MAREGGSTGMQGHPSQLKGIASKMAPRPPHFQWALGIPMISSARVQAGACMISQKWGAAMAHGMNPNITGTADHI
jgi:hypothetical protein